MGKTKAKRAENAAQFKEIKAARKAAQAELDDSPDSSSRLPPLKRTKLNNSSSSSRNNKPKNTIDEDKHNHAFFPIGLPLEDQEGERELDEAEKYLLSVRAEEDRLPSFVTVYNPYVLKPSAPTPTPRGKDLWIAGPSDPSPSFASSSSTSTAPSKTPSHRLLPTPLWRQRFLANFLQLRANLKHPSTLPSPSNPGFSTSLNPPAHYVPLPAPREREKWRQYIVGASRKKTRVVKVAEESKSNNEKPEAAAVLMDCGRKQESDVEPETVVAVGTVLEVAESRAPSPRTAAIAGDEDDEEMMDAAGEGYEGDEDDDGYQFGDATVDDGTQWYGVDGNEDEEIFPLPTHAELEEQLNDMEDESSSDEEDEGALELEPLQPKHLPKEPSLTLIQTLPESTILLLLAHLSHFLRPLPHLLNSQPSSSSPSAPPPSPYPTLTPLLTRWILSLLSKLDAHLLPSHISQLRDLARVMMEILESYAMGPRKREEAAGSVGEEEKARREEERMGCWMIWGAVVEVWAQRDLVLDMEVVFGKL